ncbi:MAG: hypothetical protein HZB83_02015 [Deltaproteobacteria bacterium]|nr:hypothetical protein [Deltaproteobacteria bacterium]
MSGLRVEYMALKSEANGFEKRLVLSKASGALQAMDDVASALGVKGKLKSVKAAGVREMKDRVLAERAEVKFEKLSMNELVNVFSRMEDYPMLLSINGISLKKSFDNPELLDLTMTVDLFTRR